MNARKNLAIATVLVAAVAIAYFLNRPLAQGPRSPLPDRSTAPARFEPSASVPRESPQPPRAPAPPAFEAEPLPIALPEKLAGRFPGAVPIELRSRALPDGNLERRLLVRAASESFPFVVWEELLEPDGKSGSHRALRSVAYRGDRFVVDADPARVDTAALDALIESEGLTRDPFMPFSNSIAIHVPNPSLERLHALLDRFAAQFPPELVGRDILYFPSAAPSDFYADRAWHLEQVNAVEAWDIESDSSQVVVAVIDTGVNVNHPDLAPNIWVNPGETPGNGIDDDGNGKIDDVRGWDFLNDDSATDDSGSHGTHVAGIASARGGNAQGTIGVNWNARILPLKAGNASALNTAAIAKALDYARALRIRGVNIVVTNNSYGSEGDDPLLRAAVGRQRDAGILFVAAAGNSSANLDGNSPEYPAAYEHANVITVVSTNQEDGLAASSSYGAESADLGAPGEWIYSTYENAYEFQSGTSMASPVVAGAIGLLAAAEPGMDWQHLKARALDTVDPAPALFGKTVTGGRLNVLSMLRPALKGHFVSVASHAEKIVVLDHARLAVDFEIDALAGAAVAAQIASGGATAQIEDLGARRFRFSATADGQYSVRFAATIGGIERSVERSVFVGALADIAGGLSHHWRFDGAGNSEPDRAGSSAGSLINATRVDTPYGRAAQFSGQAGRMDFSGSHSAQVTFAALVKPGDLAFGEQPRVINMPYYYLYMASYSSPLAPDGNRNTLKFLSERSGAFGVWNSPPRSVQNGEWLYVVGAYDSSNLMNAPRLYVNGRQLTARMQARPVGNQATAGSVSYVGNNGDNTRPFSGVMKDVRIYDRALGEPEIERLGAVLSEGKWSRYSIVASAEPVIGETVTYRLLDDAGTKPEGALSWSASSLGANTIVSNAGGEIRISYRGNASVLLAARASDGVSTRYFSEVVETEFPPITSSGVYEGQTESGGLVWLEIDPSLESGYITILQDDPAYRRARVPVSVSSDGVFASSGEGGDIIAGSVDGGFSGEIVGAGIAFTGAIQIPVSGESEYEGSYVGGELGRDGRFVRMRVLRDGRAYFWRQGPDVDLGTGQIGSSGEFGFTSERGVEVSGHAAAGSSSISGALSGAASGDIFLIAEDVERGPAFQAVSSGAFISPGAGAMLSEFKTSSEVQARIVNVDANPDDASPMASSGKALPAIKALTGEAVFTVDVSQRRGTHEMFVRSARATVDGQPALFVEMLEVAREPGGRFASAKGRGAISSEEAPAMASFEIAGPSPRLVLVRALGGDLAPFGAGSASADPVLRIERMDASGSFAEVGSNDDWAEPFGESNDAPGARAARLRESFDALDLEDPSAASDAAMLVWLEPGVYVARAFDALGDSGAALIEVYSER